ncbi:GDSL esterase/lipase [Striga hermonthica]|uniref:GDSL esterase/lipase n=1 Tax=Striga hermonthica TaxID=68872 RepID=A0A9N7NWA5_STRHE|nr:GDSL esterase/lipase [Striga hermonthica]
MPFMVALTAIAFPNGVQIVASESTPKFTAMFAFGDSLTDPGNNNYLNSLAKANYVPYGVDFDEGPSGRFCNGKTAIDYIGELLGYPALLAYTSPLATGKNVLRGVNYASAAGGILEETGRSLGERFSLSEQVENFESTLKQLRNQMTDEELVTHLSKSLVVMSLGSNDYINNYLQPSFYSTSYIYTPKDYADLLINRYTRQILALHSLGLRKFFLGGIGPLGCIPNQLAANLPPPGKCVDSTNNMVEMFNNRLVSLVDQLNSKHNNGSVFTYGNTFGAFVDILNNPKIYGFSVIDRGCCGIGRNRGQITCLPFSLPCPNRNQYVFWDAFHPTEAANQILARRAYSGSTSDCYPVNIQQMALM